ncbi:1,4-dihydroxy-2-naphthoyl-CoA hydrolase [filamentous cyanobacterium CCP5]|nr:1,4-dihydroxy-2-naphthoyl-CoA hydrolase [filamentous cyanobacterium CCP5]
MSEFSYSRTIRFHETDGAGVVYFANVLVLCHEAYEASLAFVGIDLQRFFDGQGLAYPIVHASIDFRRPLRCGQEVLIDLAPHQQQESHFEVQYHLTHDARTVGSALTRHVCIDAQRQRSPLPPEILGWIQRLRA